MPVLLMLAGMLLNTVLILAFRLWQTPWVLVPIVELDPLSFEFAEIGLSLFFDRRGIAPSPAQSVAFEGFLVIGFGAQCLAIGYVIRWLVGRAKASRRTGGVLFRSQL